MILSQPHTFNKIRWLFIALFFLVTVAGNFFYGKLIEDSIPILIVLSLFIAVILHGKARYGIKNMLIFFILTWLISHFFEALSIQTGFPFGHYYYDKLAGPRLFQVPLIIMPAYFGMIYISWMLSHILLRQYSKKLQGAQVFFLPLIAAFIMVMWDLCIDPQASTIASLWVWPNGGAYFGVPLQNYFGWFLVVYSILQIFALYIARNDLYDAQKLKLFSSKLFWQEIVALYAIQTLLQLLSPFTQTQYMEIYKPIALIAVFTMLFVTLLAFIIIENTEDAHV
ncbi:hypothetical protein BH10PSE19_BH10PSE19_15500 [soil metagenome]